MPTLCRLHLRLVSFCALVCSLAALPLPLATAQTGFASVSGRVADHSGAVIQKANVSIKNLSTGITIQSETNDVGIYSFPSVMPGNYVMHVEKQGFRSVDVTGLSVYTQDQIARNFSLEIGSASESITVNGSGVNINTTDASVSTVVDRKFVENMPLNGRSFQDLLTLAPGVALVPVNSYQGGVGASGEISVNGQRTEANYFSVDGVSANTGTAPNATAVQGAGISGGTPGETILGTTQSIVSIDALQEFRASTSTYSAEYGRTPGGQFSFSTRSGTNEWDGSAYDYFRNDAMDANNWFNNAANPQVPRLPERQNDFGGTLGGPIVIPGLYTGKDKTFFFFSYEGLRLTVPQPFQQFSVPDMALRQQVPVALQPFLNVFPVPNGGEDGLNDGLAHFNLAYSSPSSLDNVGMRVDHSFGNKLKIFGRYARTPSSNWTYFLPAIRLNQAINVQTLTLGTTSSITPTQANELRFNITQNNANSSLTSTNFGGATPLDLRDISGPNGQPATPIGSEVLFYLGFGSIPYWVVGANTNSQRQYNVTDNYSWSRATHQIKFGVDWRRLTTSVRPITNQQGAIFFSEASLLADSADFARAQSFTNIPVEPVYHNFSAFVQDEWKATPRLSLSLGLRWDINPPPGNATGPSPYTVDQISDLATTKLAPKNTPLWSTDWRGFAPRAGLAYQLHQAPGHETVLRTGFGTFYDMGNTQGSQGFYLGVGFSSSTAFFGVPFPLTSAQVTLPPPSVAPPYNATVYAFDPNLKLPYTMQWNVSVEQGLGTRQTLTLSYVGSGGRKLLSQFLYSPTSPDFSLSNGLFLTANRVSSDYDALQVKFQKSLSRGLQALASYTFSHSIDDASSNFQVYELLRASSDFDIRHNFQAAVTYDVPGSYSNVVASALLKHWGLDTRISARSALPVDIVGLSTIDPATQKNLNFHPDRVAGQPVYLYGSQYPGRRIINFQAFTPAPAGVDGNVGRNSARGFDAVQADLALRRDFPIREQLHLQFRAEAFNVFNHASFGSIYNQLSYGPGQFGYSYSTLSNSLGGLNSLYQSGGPRSLQLMLKLQF
jgi:hypothetical protein